MVVNANASYAVGDRAEPFEICNSISAGGKEDCFGRLLSSMKAYAKPGQDYKSLCSKISDAEWRRRCKGL